MDETTLLPRTIDWQGLVYQDKSQLVYRVAATFDGFAKEYFVSDRGERAAVVVIRRNEILLVRQYRLLIDDLSWEIPGGKVDEGEAPETAALRECQEETGVRCCNLRRLISYHPGLDVWKNYTHVFYADEFTEPADLAVENQRRRVWVPLAKCIEMIFGQQIVDSLSIIALLAYQTLRSQRASSPKL